MKDTPQSPTVETAPDNLQPPPNLCSGCRHAIWYQLPRSLHCRCTLRGTESYNSATPSRAISVCDGPRKGTELSKLILQRDVQIDFDHPGSATFEQVPSSQLPSGPTPCSHCPSAVWYAQPSETYCACLLLHAESYSSEAQNAWVERCDGMLISTLSLLKKRAG